MPTKVVLSTFPGNVVKIGDDCYEFSKVTEDPVSAEADQVFDTCEDCQNHYRYRRCVINYRYRRCNLPSSSSGSGSDSSSSSG